MISTFRHESSGRSMDVHLDDQEGFERLRDALGDPVWLVGATYQILHTNDYKRGRFEDAFGAWLARQDIDAAVALLTAAGITATASS